MSEDSKDEKHEFPHWEELYQQQEVESMPWFNPELDYDLEKALDELGLRSGSALDLGTGPGTQAIHLARRGFTVTATDISEAATRLASEKARKEGIEITWEQDDILDTRLDRQFDLIFDRGLFHVLAPERYRFTPEQIREIFGSRLSVLSIKETVYQGTLDPLPHALFCIMRKRKIESKEALRRMTELSEEMGLYDE